MAKTSSTPTKSQEQANFEIPTVNVPGGILTNISQITEFLKEFREQEELIGTIREIIEALREEDLSTENLQRVKDLETLAKSLGLDETGYKNRQVKV